MLHTQQLNACERTSKEAARHRVSVACGRSWSTRDRRVAARANTALMAERHEADGGAQQALILRVRGGGGALTGTRARLLHVYGHEEVGQMHALLVRRTAPRQPHAVAVLG